MMKDSAIRPLASFGNALLKTSLVKTSESNG